MTVLPADCPRLSALADDELRAAILERIESYPIAAHPDAIYERALAYPFEPPPYSYVLVGRHALPVSGADHVVLDDDHVSIETACERLGVDPTPLGGRHPVLAYGSNGSPAALLRKFARTVEEESELVLPVLQGTLDGFDVVYSSHLSAYGSVPATLHPAPGTAITTYVTLLTDAQIVRLMETEFNYEVRLLDDVSFDGKFFRAAQLIAFVSRHGTLGIEGRPVPLAAIRRVSDEGVDGTAPPRTEPEMLERVRDHLRPDEELRDFVLRNVADPRRALAHTYQLREQRLVFDYERSTVLDA